MPVINGEKDFSRNRIDRCRSCFQSSNCTNCSRLFEHDVTHSTDYSGSTHDRISAVIHRSSSGMRALPLQSDMRPVSALSTCDHADISILCFQYWTLFNMQFVVCLDRKYFTWSFSQLFCAPQFVLNSDSIRILVCVNISLFKDSRKNSGTHHRWGETRTFFVCPDRDFYR